MPVKEKVSDLVDAYVRSGHVPTQVDADLYRDIQEATGEHDDDPTLLQVRPFPENSGIEGSEELLQAMHDLRTKLSIFNDSKKLAFEMWFNEGAIQFHFYIVDDQQEEKLRRQIDAHYPNAAIVEKDSLFPNIYENDWVAGAELHLKQSNYYPIKNPRGVRNLISDPYRSITSDLLAAESDRICVQVTMRPALGTWTHGGMLGYINPLNEDIYEVADDLKGQQRIPDSSHKESRDPTSEERQLAENIARQEGLPAYHINVRILSFSPDKGTAKSNVWGVARTFEQSFQEAGGQQFVQQPLGGLELKELITDAARRELYHEDIILTIPEVATVAHIPNESIETPSVDWNNTQATARIPASAERFDENEGTGNQFNLNDQQQQEEQAEGGPGSEFADEPLEEQMEDPIDDPFEDEPAPHEQEAGGEQPPAEDPDPFADDPLPHEQEPEPGEEVDSEGTAQQPPTDQQSQHETPPANDQPDQSAGEHPDDQPPQGGHSPQGRPANEQSQQLGASGHTGDQRQSPSGEEETPDFGDDGGIISRVLRAVGFEGERGFQQGDDSGAGSQPSGGESDAEEAGGPKPASERPEQRNTAKRKENLQRQGTDAPADQPGRTPDVPSDEPEQQPEDGGSQSDDPYPDQNASGGSHEPMMGEPDREPVQDDPWAEDPAADPDEEPTVEDVEREFEEEFEKMEKAEKGDEDDEPESRGR